MIVADPRFRPWLEAKIGVALADDAVFIGEIRDGLILSAIAFSHWTGHDMDVSVAGSQGSRGILQAFYQYVFDQHRCCRATARIRASNLASQRLAERLGFQREGVLRQGYGDEDALIYGLLQQDFPYGKRWRQTPLSSRPQRHHSAPVAVQPLREQRTLR